MGSAHSRLDSVPPNVCPHPHPRTCEVDLFKIGSLQMWLSLGSQDELDHPGFSEGPESNGGCPPKNQERRGDTSIHAASALTTPAESA